MNTHRARSVLPEGRQWVGPIVVGVIATIAGIYFGTAILDLREQAVASDTTTAVLAEDVDALREQVTELGEEPVAPPAEETVEDIPTDRPAAPIIIQGTPGRTGPGPTQDQVEAAVGQLLPGMIQDPIARAVADGLAASPPEDGTDGRDGRDGTDGRGIASAEVVDCNLILTYDDGTTQNAGGVCIQGDTGSAGADGQPPLSWTFTFPDGKLHTCARTDPFDPAAPTYTCTPESQAPE